MVVLKVCVFVSDFSLAGSAFSCLFFCLNGSLCSFSASVLVCVFFLSACFCLFASLLLSLAFFFSPSLLLWLSASYFLDIASLFLLLFLFFLLSLPCLRLYFSAYFLSWVFLQCFLVLLPFAFLMTFRTPFWAIHRMSVFIPKFWGAIWSFLVALGDLPLGSSFPHNPRKTHKIKQICYY